MPEQTWHKLEIHLRGTAPVSIMFERQKTAEMWAIRLLEKTSKPVVRIEGFKHTPLIMRIVFRIRAADVTATSVEPISTITWSPEIMKELE